MTDATQQPLPPVSTTNPPSGQFSWPDWLKWSLILFLFFGICVFFTYPIALNFTSAVPGLGVEDRLQNLWNFWWLRKAFLGFHYPYLTDFLFYPYYQPPFSPLPLYFHDLQALSGLLTLPFQFLGGEIAAYNATVFLESYFSAVGTYLLSRKLGASVPASLVAGVIYGFAPIRLSAINQSITNIQATEFLPFYAFFLISLPAFPVRIGWWSSLNKKMLVGAVLTLVACMYTDWYNSIYLLSFTVFYFGWRILANRSWSNLFAQVKLLMLVAGLSFILIAPLLVPSVLNLKNPAFRTELGFDRELKSSATLLSLLVPESLSALTPVNTLSLTAVLLALLAGLSLFRPKALEVVGWLSRSTAAFWLLLSVVALVMALGPELRLTRDTNTHLPLPYALFRLLPGVSITRAPARFVILAMLGLAVLAAFSLDWMVTSRLAGRVLKGFNPALRKTLPGSVLAVLTFLLFSLEVWSPLPLFVARPNSFLESLANEPGDFYLLELPITRHYNHDHFRMFNQIAHQRPIVGGYLSRPVIDPYRFPDSAFKPIADFQLRDTNKPPLPDIILRTNNYQDLDDLVTTYKFRYIVLYQKEFDSPNQLSGVIDLISRHYGTQQQLYKDDELIVYRVPADLAAQLQGVIDLTLGGGWNDLEQNPKDKNRPLWRWSEQTARIYATAYTASKASLEFQLISFQTERTLQVQLNRQTIYQIKVAPDQLKSVAIDLMLPAGRNEISLTSLEGDQSPAELDPNSKDTRRLAFAVNSVKISRKNSQAALNYLSERIYDEQ